MLFTDSIKYTLLHFLISGQVSGVCLVLFIDSIKYTLLHFLISGQVQLITDIICKENEGKKESKSGSRHRCAQGGEAGG